MTLVSYCLFDVTNRTKTAHPKPIAAATDPEIHNAPDGLSHAIILPIEIRLLSGEQMQVVFIRWLVVFPRRACVIYT